MGIPRELAVGTIRFSLGRETTLDDINRSVEVVPGVVEKVRKLAGVLGRTDARGAGNQHTAAVEAAAAAPYRGSQNSL
jgi:hypothetical protein